MTTPTCPLEVDALAGVDAESVGDEVVLHGGVCLHDVPPLSAHVHVVYALCAGGRVHDHGARTQEHHVGTVLESAAKLGGVDGQAKGLVGGGANVDVGVLLHRGTASSAPVGDTRGSCDTEGYSMHQLTGMRQRSCR